MTRPNLFAGLALAGLCLAATATALGNDYAQDDMPVIQRNPVVHQFDLASFFTESYWPKPFPPALYRPLATTGFALQWQVGGGSPLAFRITSILMYAAAGFALFLLARMMLPLGAAWIAAALFMIHPVHVEAVAIAVNQSEIMVGLLACLTVLLYLRAREETGAFTPRLGALLFVLYLAATLFKETGLVIIGLIVAAELTVVRDTRPPLARLAAIRPLLLVMLLGATSFFAIRTLALGGDPVGTFTAEALVGQTIGGRALTMLAVVPHWFRLLLWPAHLQGDYSPREIEQATTWGIDQTQGATLLLLAVLLTLLSWKRYPVIAFGLLWTGIGLFPVSNVLVPTGIVLAERTLFLPSVGMMIALGGLAALILARLRDAGRPARLVAAALFGAVLVMGTTRSASRQTVWKDQFTFWHQTTIDAPLSYRARHAMAQLLFHAGARGQAEREYRMAIALYPKTWGAQVDLADRLRLDGQCEPAIPYYRQALVIDSEHGSARASMIACLFHLGRYGEARNESREGLAYARSPHEVVIFQRFLAVADSAAGVQAAPGTVRLSIPAADSTE